MVEHAALRVHFRYVNVMSSIYELEDFVRSCHARIEDEIVFPMLRKSLGQKLAQKLEEVIPRLEADHKLICTIGEQIKVKTVEGDLETLKKRILLYASTVVSHNASEESLIFQYWDGEEKVVSKARTIIEDFGLNRYFAITGISQRLFERIA